MFEVLIPAVVGGLIAIVGGLVGPPFLHRLQVEAEKRKRRAEKFEELVVVLHEHKHWLHTVQKIRAHGNGFSVEPVSPFSKVQAIASLYFQEFIDKITALELAADEYELWMWDATKKSRDVRDFRNKDFTDSHLKAYLPYREAFVALLEELRAFARREFQ